MLRSLVGSEMCIRDRNQLREEVKIVIMNKKKASSLQLKLVKIEKEMERLNAIENETKAVSAGIPNIANGHKKSPNISLSDEEKLEESKVPAETIESPFASPISMSIEVRNIANKVTVDDTDVSEAYRKFFKCVIPLLEGREVYKKAPGKHPYFDPLNGSHLEKCGYLSLIHI